MQTPLLEIDNLKISFDNGNIPVLRGVSLMLSAGEVLGLVGESGSGKSMSALSLMGLLPPGASVDGGSIIFSGQNLLESNTKERRLVCGQHIGMVFQEPMTALNPVLRIGEQLAEIFRYRRSLSKLDAWNEAVKQLARVGLPNPGEAAKSYPHRFSGGMRQRVVIAQALALNPEMIIADEPTTALDPTVAGQILDLIKGLTKENNSAVLFITHNLRLLKSMAKKIAVMYTGLIVELSDNLLNEPLHPYTQGLIKALPPLTGSGIPKRLCSIRGMPPSPGDYPQGCPFEPRCDKALKICKLELPPLINLANGSQVRCFLYGG